MTGSWFHWDSFALRKGHRKKLTGMRNIPFNLPQTWDKLSASLSITQVKYLLLVNYPIIQITWIWIISHDIGSCMSLYTTLHCIIFSILGFGSLFNTLILECNQIILAFIDSFYLSSMKNTEKHGLNICVTAQFLFGMLLGSFDKLSIYLCNFYQACAFTSVYRWNCWHSMTSLNP